MKTKFATIQLIAGHCGKMQIRQLPYIVDDISHIINRNMHNQSTGDYMLDLNSFYELGGEFEVSHIDEQNNQITDACHEQVESRLHLNEGILRLRLGKIMSYKLGGYIVRVWNFIDRIENTIDWNISPIGTSIPINVKNALRESYRFFQINRTTPISSSKKTTRKDLTISENNFDVAKILRNPRCEIWSPNPNHNLDRNPLIF